MIVYMAAANGHDAYQYNAMVYESKAECEAAMNSVPKGVGVSKIECDSTVFQKAHKKWFAPIADAKWNITKSSQRKTTKFLMIVFGFVRIAGKLSWNMTPNSKCHMWSRRKRNDRTYRSCRTLDHVPVRWCNTQLDRIGQWQKPWSGLFFRYCSQDWLSRRLVFFSQATMTKTSRMECYDPVRMVLRSTRRTHSALDYLGLLVWQRMRIAVTKYPVSYAHAFGVWFRCGEYDVSVSIAFWSSIVALTLYKRWRFTRHSTDMAASQPANRKRNSRRPKAPNAISWSKF